jgi:hypothetical protein
VSWLVVWWDRLVVRCFGELAALWVCSGDSSVGELVGCLVGLVGGQFRA